MPKENPILENVFGTIGAILWTIQIIPQIWKSYRSKDTEGLSGMLMFVWAVAAIFLGTYAIVENINIPIILQPQVFGVLSALSWAQTLHYGPRKFSLLKAGACFAAFCAVFGAFEGGMCVVLKNAKNAGNDRPTFAFGIISAVLISGALIPQFYEIWKLKEVKGISLIFMAVDMGGGVFCVLSLAFKSSIDPVATANYAGVVILDGLILLLAAILNPRARRRRAREAALEGGNAEKGPDPDATGGRIGDLEQGEMEEEKEARRLQDKEALEFPAGTPGRILDTDSRTHSQSHLWSRTHLEAGNPHLVSRETTICALDQEEMEKHGPHVRKEDTERKDDPAGFRGEASEGIDR